MEIIKRFKNQFQGRNQSTKPVINGGDTVTVSMESLISRRHDALKLPLNPGKIKARLSGNYLSAFKGRGMEFDEVRGYQLGDDIRNIDWKVTARSGKPQTKLFREERERSVLFMLDLRPSMFFATRGAFKSVIAAHITSLMAWSANQHGDRVGGLIFSNQKHLELRPKRGKQAVLQLIKQVTDHPGWQHDKETYNQPETMTRTLSRLRKVTKPGSLVFMLSDFRQMDDQAFSHLSQLSCHNDIILIFIYDQLESQLPPPGIYPITDGTQNQQLNTLSGARRQHYHHQFEARLEHLKQLCLQYKMHLLTCSTQQDIMTTLQKELGLHRP